MKNIVAFIILTTPITFDVIAAPMVRRLSPITSASAISSVRASSPMRTITKPATTTAARLGATTATATSSANNSRLSLSSFLGGRGKIPLSTSGGNNNNNNVNASEFVSNDEFDTAITDIDNDIDAIRDAMADLEINGVPGADGKSAFEIAQAAGFTGTESDWLASLVGAPGDKGEPGADGGAACASNGDGTYMINVVGGAETCVSVATTADVFTE